MTSVLPATGSATGLSLLAHHDLGGVAKLVTIVSFTRDSGKVARRLGDRRQPQPARGADDILRQPRRIVPFLLGTGL